MTTASKGRRKSQTSKNPIPRSPRRTARVAPAPVAVPEPSLSVALRAAAYWVRSAVAGILPKRERKAEAAADTGVVVPWKDWAPDKPAPGRKRGRPVGSKDKKPRKRRSSSDMASSETTRSAESVASPKVVSIEKASRDRKRRRARAESAGTAGVGDPVGSLTATSMTDGVKAAGRGRRSRAVKVHAGTNGNPPARADDSLPR